MTAITLNSDQKAAVALWWRKPWSQLPGGSLPSDERVLAHISEVKSRYAKVRNMAFCGRVQCSDGRLYHPVVSKKARTEVAWNAKKQKSYNRDITQKTSVTEAVAGSVIENDSEAITGTVTEPVAEPVAETVTCPVTQIVTGSNRPYQTRPSSLRSDSASLRSAGAADATPASGSKNDPKTTDRGLFDDHSPPNDPEPHDIPNPKQALFREGVSIFRNLTGQFDTKARSQIWVLRWNFGNNCGAIIAIILNEALIEVGETREAAFGRIFRHSAFRAAIARGAIPVWMPKLLAAQQVESSRLHFRDAVDGHVGQGHTPLGPFDRSRVHHWLHAMDANFAGIRTWLP